MANRMNERRGFVRVPFNTEVEVHVQGRMILSQEKVDLSMSGIRLSTRDAIPPPGALCRVKIILQASEPRLIIEASGKVARSDPGSLAVEFTELDPDGYHHLQQVILNNTDDPEKAEKEFAEHWGIRKPRR